MFPRGRYNRGRRGRYSYLFVQAGRGADSSVAYSRMKNENSNEVVAGTDGESYHSFTYYGCGFKGHYRNQYHYASRKITICIHNGYSFTQGNLSFQIHGCYQIHAPLTI